MQEMAKLSKNNAYSMLFIACLTISTGCLTVGYIFAGIWQIVLLFPLLLILWLLTYKQSTYLSASIFLIGFVIIAALGILLDFSVILMIFGCVTALVSWELFQFAQNNMGNSLDKNNFLREKYHLTSLVLTASLGLILALMSANVSLRIPFIVVGFLVLIFMGCLIYGIQFVVRKKY
jgi:hypothetical protein